MTDQDLMMKILNLEERITQLSEDGFDTQELEEMLQSMKDGLGTAA